MNCTPDRIVQSELEALRAAFGASEIYMHNGGQYDESKLTGSDMVLVTSYNQTLKGMGVGNEAITALKYGIPAYLLIDINQTDNQYIVERIVQVDDYNMTEYTKSRYSVITDDDFQEGLYYLASQNQKAESLEPSDEDLLL